MNRLITRITKLERLVHVGPAAELRALTDEELKARLDELLAAMTEADVLELTRQLHAAFMACCSAGGNSNEEVPHSHLLAACRA